MRFVCLDILLRTQCLASKRAVVANCIDVSKPLPFLKTQVSEVVDRFY